MFKYKHSGISQYPENTNFVRNLLLCKSRDRLCRDITILKRLRDTWNVLFAVVAVGNRKSELKSVNI